MISKFSVSMLVAIATFFVAAPMANVSAAASTKDQIKKYSKQLSALPNGGASAGTVSKLVTKLAKLDPKKAAKYYATGLTKLSNAGNTAKGDSTKIALQVSKIVKKSGLSTSQIDKINKKVTKENLDYTPPPTPTPPS